MISPLLPTEILFQIVAYVTEPEDLKRTSLASKVLLDIARRQIWDALVIDAEDEEDEGSASDHLIERLGCIQASPHLHSYIRTLEIYLEALSNDENAPAHLALVTLILSLQQLNTVALIDFGDRKTDHFIAAIALYASQKTLRTFVVRGAKDDEPPVTPSPTLLPGTTLQFRELILDITDYDDEGESRHYSSAFVAQILPMVTQSLTTLVLRGGMIGDCEGLTFTSLEVLKAPIYSNLELAEFLSRHPTIFHLELPFLETLLPLPSNALPNLHTFMGTSAVVQVLAPGRPVRSFDWMECAEASGEATRRIFGILGGGLKRLHGPVPASFAVLGAIIERCRLLEDITICSKHRVCLVTCVLTSLSDLILQEYVSAVELLCTLPALRQVEFSQDYDEVRGQKILQKPRRTLQKLASCCARLSKVVWHEHGVYARRRIWNVGFPHVSAIQGQWEWYALNDDRRVDRDVRVAILCSW